MEGIKKRQIVHKRGEACQLVRKGGKGVKKAWSPPKSRTILRLRFCTHREGYAAAEADVKELVPESERQM